MEYIIHLLILIAIYGILSVSLNLVVGYAGLLSVTHAAFYGLGAYATAIMMARQGMGFFSSVAVGMVVSGSMALLIGIVLSKFKGDYYALVSFGFNIIMFSIFLNWQELTRGPLGIPGIGKPVLFDISFASNAAFFGLAAALCMFAYCIAHFITSSSFGRALKAIREDEQAISVFGYRTPHFKLVIFVIAAMMASVAGSLFASYISFIDPSTFTLNESVFILAIIILGGLASLRGSFLGAVCLIILPELLRFVGFPSDVAAQMRQVAYGLILIILMMYRPQGLIGEYKL